MKYVWLITLAVVGSALCWGSVSAQCVVGNGPPPGQPAAPCYIAPPQQPVSRAQACKELQQEYDNCVRSVASSNAAAVSLALQNNPGASDIWLRGFERSLVTPEAECGELKTDMWQYGCP